MSALVTPDEMRAAEAAAIAAGRPEPELMRAASEQIATWLDEHVPVVSDRARTAVAFVGPGNNGGDALVTLALLVERGWTSHAIYLGRDEPGDLPVAATLLDSVQRSETSSLLSADVILDGVYGIGGRASIPPAVREAFRLAHERRMLHGTPLVAIDVPSGIDAGSGDATEDAFRADVTLCLGLPKIGLIREPAASHVGELVLLDIGVEPPADGRERPELIDESLVRRSLPVRRASAHKHHTGTVLVIGGAPTYYGAPRLSAETAARAGAGLTCVAIPESIAPVIAAQVPELVILPLEESSSRSATQILDWIEQRGGNVDSFVIGPGLGQSPVTTQLLEQLLGDPVDGMSSRVKRDGQPGYVVDADALNWIAKRGEFPASIPAGSAVLTPHAGELSRLTGIPAGELVRDPIESARSAAVQFGQTVIFKTGFSVAAEPSGAVAVAPRSSPELATAGTGDVLAGLVGGLVAQGLEPFTASRVALFVGSRAGRRASIVRGVHGVLARDVIEMIPAEMSALSMPILTFGK